MRLLFALAKLSWDFGLMQCDAVQTMLEYCLVRDANNEMCVSFTRFFFVFVFLVGVGIRLCGSVSVVNCDITLVRLRIEIKISLESRENENEYCFTFIYSVQFGMKLDSRFARDRSDVNWNHLHNKILHAFVDATRRDLRASQIWYPTEMLSIWIFSISRFVLSALFSRRTWHQLDVDVNEHDGNSNLEIVVIEVNVLFF